jgi:hypothetical protein
MKKIILLLIFIGISFCDEFNIDAIMDDAKKDEKIADIELGSFTKDASKNFGKLKKEYHDKYEYVPPSKNASSAQKAGFCHSYTIKNDGDKYFCLAFAKNDKNLCHSYQLTNRQRNICLGFCYESGLSKSDRNYCLAIKNNDKNYCYSLSGDYQKMCLGRFNKSNCYSLGSEKDRNMCIGMSLN